MVDRSYPPGAHPVVEGTRMICSGARKRAFTQRLRQIGTGQGPRHIEVPASAKVIVVEDAHTRQLQFCDWHGSGTKAVGRASRSPLARRCRRGFTVGILDESLTVHAIVTPGALAAPVLRRNLRSLIEFVLQLPFESDQI